MEVIRKNTYGFYIHGISFQGWRHFCDFLLQPLKRWHKQKYDMLPWRHSNHTLLSYAMLIYFLLTRPAFLQVHFFTYPRYRLLYNQIDFPIIANIEILFIPMTRMVLYKFLWRHDFFICTPWRQQEPLFFWHVPALVLLQGIWLLGLWSNWAGAGFPCLWLALLPPTLYISCWTRKLRKGLADWFLAFWIS